MEGLVEVKIWRKKFAFQKFTKNNSPTGGLFVFHGKTNRTL